MKVTQLYKKFPAFYRTRSFITVFPVLSQMNPDNTFPPYFPKRSLGLAIKFGELYKLWSPSLHHFLQPSRTSFRNILLSTMSSNTLHLRMFFPYGERPINEKIHHSYWDLSVRKREQRQLCQCSD